MRTATHRLIQDLVTTIARMSIVAETLPDKGPKPYMICVQNPGEIRFRGKEAVDEVVAAFGGPSGWMRIPNHEAGCYDYRKFLHNGIAVWIENARSMNESDMIAFPEAPSQRR